MQDLTSQLEAIHARNRRVEQDKAWEQSYTRCGFIVIVTYLTATLFLWLIGETLPFFKALIPTGGYILSSLSLPWLKKRWMDQRGQ